MVEKSVAVPACAPSGPARKKGGWCGSPQRRRKGRWSSNNSTKRRRQKKREKRVFPDVASQREGFCADEGDVIAEPREALSSDGGAGWLGASLRCRAGGDAPASLRPAVRYRLSADAGLVARLQDFAAAPTAAVQIGLRGAVLGDGEEERTIWSRREQDARENSGARGKPSSPSRPR
jgi:hypothetical protein